MHPYSMPCRHVQICILSSGSLSISQSEKRTHIQRRTHRRNINPLVDLFNQNNSWKGVWPKAFPRHNAEATEGMLLALRRQPPTVQRA